MQDQKIAAFGSSYRGVFCQTISVTWQSLVSKSVTSSS